MNITRLPNGVEIPTIGFGTAFENKNDVEISSIVKYAIRCGYRLIDTAAVYQSESPIGDTISKLVDKGEIKREDLFISSKLAPDKHGYYSALSSFEESLNRLRTDYLDLYLIHWPVPRNLEKNYVEKNIETWQAFEELYRNGRVKAIGVCNFLERHLLQIFDTCTIRPMINQLEIHPQFQQCGLVRFCRENGLIVEAWSPLRSGNIFRTIDFDALTQKYNKSQSQICLRWNIQKGNIPIPRSSNNERIRENIGVFDFTIENEDMEYIDKMNTCDQHLDIWSYKRQQMY